MKNLRVICVLLAILTVTLSFSACTSKQANNMEQDKGNILTYGVRGNVLDVINSEGKVIDSVNFNENATVRRLYVSSFGEYKSIKKTFLAKYLFDKCKTNRIKPDNVDENSLGYIYTALGYDPVFNIQIKYDENLWDLKVIDEYGNEKFDLRDKQYIDYEYIEYIGDGHFLASGGKKDIILDLNGHELSDVLSKEQTQSLIDKYYKDQYYYDGDEELEKLSDDIYVNDCDELVNKDNKKIIDPNKYDLEGYSKEGFILSKHETVEFYDINRKLLKTLKKVIFVSKLSDDVYKCEFEDGKTYAVTINGKVLFKCVKNEELGNSKNGAFKFRNLKGLMGLIDIHKNTLLDCKYEKIRFMKDGRLFTRIDDKSYEILDEKYNVVRQFSSEIPVSGDFKNGCCLIEKKGKQGLINESGEFIAKPIYDVLSYLNENWLEKNYIPLPKTKWQESTFDNKVVNKYSSFTQVESQDDSVALAEQNGRVKLINGLGKVIKVIPKKYNKGLRYIARKKYESDVLVFNIKKNYYIMDRKSNIKKLNFSFVSDFDGDLALARLNKEAVLINKDGKVIKRSGLSWNKYFDNIDYDKYIKDGLIIGWNNVYDMNFKSVFKEKNIYSAYINDDYIYDEPGVCDGYDVDIYNRKGEFLKHFDTLSEPVEMCQMGHFIENIAVRPKSNSAFVYKDKSFNNIFDESFIAASTFYKGRAYVMDGDRKSWIIDKSGKRIMKLPENMLASQLDNKESNNGMIPIGYKGTEYWLNLETGLMFPNQYYKYKEDCYWTDSEYNSMYDRSTKKFFIVNKNGEITSKERYDRISMWG